MNEPIAWWINAFEYEHVGVINRAECDIYGELTVPCIMEGLYSRFPW